MFVIFIFPQNSWAKPDINCYASVISWQLDITVLVKIIYAYLILKL